VVDHFAAANTLIDDGRRHFTLAETGNRHLFGNVLVGVVEAGFELLGADRDDQLHAGGAQVFSRCLWAQRFLRFFVIDIDGRGDRIRTCGLPLPKRALYQAELHPEASRTWALPQQFASSHQVTSGKSSPAHRAPGTKPVKVQ
jgi:hypothetical protein